MLLSEMLGVERDTDFGVKGYESFRFNINTTFNGMDRLYYKHNDGCWIFAKSEMLTDIIYGAPGNIIHLPPLLSDEQRTALMALYTLGARWIAKDETELMWAYKEKPLRGYNVWCAKPSMSGHMKIFDDAPVSLLVSWSDPEPFDIGKALGIKN